MTQPQPRPAFSQRLRALLAKHGRPPAQDATPDDVARATLAALDARDAQRAINDAAEQLYRKAWGKRP